MNILGITCTHDASACVLADGAILANAAEERFSRVKHDWGFPIAAIKSCLVQSGLSGSDIDVVVIAAQRPPIGLIDRFVLSADQMAALAELWPHDSEGRKRFLSGAERDLALDFDRIELGSHCRFVCVEHHLAHAAAAYFTRGSKERCMIATLDGVGDYLSTAIWTGEGNTISRVRSWGPESSLGWFYGNATEALGWQHGDGEGTVMGLAPYGDPQKVGDRLNRFHPVFKEGELVAPHQFGRWSSFSDHGNHHAHLPEALGIRRIADTCGREAVAARAQQIIEQQVLGLVRHWTGALNVRRLACGGGLFLNVKLNQRIWYETDLEEQWIYPDPGDGGLAVGAALYAWHHFTQPEGATKLDTLYHGPEFGDAEIRRILEARQLEFCELQDPAFTAATLLAQGQIVAWFQGRMEAGPRALGGRSSLMAADKPENKDTLNSKVKFREGFRPFCPSMLAEKRADYLRRSRDEPFMITSFDITPEKRDRVPAVVHVDGTVRPQTVKRQANPRYYDLIRHFGELTGEYLLLNTSLNIKGEPMVCHPREALRCFYDTGIDALVMGNFLLAKRSRVKTP
jgi:carbamoyltransferase